jgi:cell division protein YceG involved in septum cleavage
VRPPTCSRAGWRPDRVKVQALTRGKRPQPSSERTEEERERDRAERERRRAERAGIQHRDGPAAPTPSIAPSADEGLIGTGPAPEAAAFVSSPAEPPPLADASPADLPAADPPSADLPAESVEEAVPAEVLPAEVVAAQSRPIEEPQPVVEQPAREPSSRARRSITSTRRPGRRSPIARVLALVALAAVLAAVVLLAKSLLGSGKEKHVPVVAVTKVVIPEGKTRLQIAGIAAADGLAGSYKTASKRSGLLSPSHYGAPAGTRDLEGFLFPATYDMFPHAPASRLVDEQLLAFKENFGAEESQRARALHVTPYQLLTVASMVEREAQVPGDRAKIAAVIYNRLRQGIPLGIDATIYYAVERRLGIATYTHELTEAQLHIDSPYNTRLHTGLPPTPISNPGLASITAAAHPARVAYLYYVAAADGCGEQVFSITLAEFETNAAAYKAAVKKNGGAPPSCKH